MLFFLFDFVAIGSILYIWFYFVAFCCVQILKVFSCYFLSYFSYFCISEYLLVYFCCVLLCACRFLSESYIFVWNGSSLFIRLEVAISVWFCCNRLCFVYPILFCCILLRSDLKGISILFLVLFFLFLYISFYSVTNCRILSHFVTIRESLSISLYSVGIVINLCLHRNKDMLLSILPVLWCRRRSGRD